MIKEKLNSIEFQITGKEYSFATFSFAYFEEEDIDEFKKKYEKEIKDLIRRDILFSIANLVKIFSGHKTLPTISSKLKINYRKNVYQKVYFDCTIALGDIKAIHKEWDMFSCAILIRNYSEGFYDIDNGYFNLEFVALKWKVEDYLVESFTNPNVEEKLKKLTKRILSGMERFARDTLEESDLKIKLSSWQQPKYAFIDGVDIKHPYLVEAIINPMEFEEKPKTQSSVKKQSNSDNSSESSSNQVVSIKGTVSKGNTKEALEMALELFKDSEPKKYNQIITLLAELNENNHDRRLGLSLDNTSKNRIRMALLELLDE